MIDEEASPLSCPSKMFDRQKPEPFDTDPFEAGASEGAEINPYAPTAETATPPEGLTVPNVGIGRGLYFGLIFAIGLLQEFLEENAGFSQTSMEIFPTLIGSIVTLWLTSLRLQNMGYTGRWCLGLLIPILNLLVFLKCLGCPAGYAVDKKLDTTGWVLLAIMLGMIVIGGIAIILDL